MKARLIQIHLMPGHARLAGAARLANPDDPEVRTEEQAAAYPGPTFLEGPSTDDLHVVYRDGFVCVNFIDDNRERVNYDFPMSTVSRVKRVAN